MALTVEVKAESPCTGIFLLQPFSVPLRDDNTNTIPQHVLNRVPPTLTFLLCGEEC
jgi:hypothetical protein